MPFLYFLHFCHFYNFLLNFRTLLSNHRSTHPILSHIYSRTSKFIILLFLNPLWNCHILDSMTTNWLLLLLYCTLARKKRSSALQFSRRLTVMVNCFVFLAKYSWHAFYIFHLLRHSRNCTSILGKSRVIYHRADALLKDAVQVTLSIVH